MQRLDRLRGSAAAAPGFTLVELLVVIGIIAMLAGILFPAFARVRAKSYESVCISNMRQIGHAFRMYEQDYGDTPRFMQLLCDGRYITDTRILRCPGDTDGNRGGSYTRHTLWRPLMDETVRYSYLDLWAAKGDRGGSMVWPTLLANESVAGLLTCDVHGQPCLAERYDPPGFGDHEGLVLRLQFDGSVVRRTITWPRTPWLLVQDPWPYFCDCPNPYPHNDLRAWARMR